MIAMSFDDMQEYVLHADRELPPTEQTVFVLRPMSERARRRLENMLGREMKLEAESAAEATMSVPVGDLHALCLQSGIADWRNLKDAKGRTVEYRRDKTGEMAAELLLCFTVLQKAELTRQIMSLNGLTGRDEKN